MIQHHHCVQDHRLQLFPKHHLRYCDQTFSVDSAVKQTCFLVEYFIHAFAGLDSDVSSLVADWFKQYAEVAPDHYPPMMSSLE